VANDFSLPPDHAISRHDELIDRVSLAVSLYNRWRRFKGPWLLVALLAIGVGIGLAFGLALGLGLSAG
jgi:putative effector of murein hydrolase